MKHKSLITCKPIYFAHSLSIIRVMTVPARVLNSSDIILLLYDNDFIILQLFLLYINKYLFLLFL